MRPNNKIVSFFNAIFVNFRHFKIISGIERVVRKMSLTEKVLFYLASLVFVVSSLFMVLQVHNLFLVEVPAFGGSFTEGVIGSPRFINPVLALSDTDKDLTSLIYAGLLRSGHNGEFENDLAKSFSIEEGGILYRVILKDNIFFHDGQRVTSEDIVFTVEKLKDPVIKSPKVSSWAGVVAERVNDMEVVFRLSQPYSPFIEALTIGILPKHIWENVSPEEFPFSQFNINPIGAGPYEVAKIVRNQGGIPTSISLLSWEKYAPERSKIKSITFKFFQNEETLFEAFKKEEVESLAGFNPSRAQYFINQEEKVLNESALPRVFGLFLNQNLAPVFLNKEVREALNLAAPKERIVNEVLYGFARVLNGPTPVDIELDQAKAAGNLEAAQNILAEAGWEAGGDQILEKKTKSGTERLSFAISTSDASELKEVALILKEVWEQLGAEIEIKIFEAGDLSQNIIKGRKYDALLFGEVVGERGDLYPFWHSSARLDPGLNVALYTNITVDEMLEAIQNDTDYIKNAERKEVVVAEIKEDLPAIFFFSPELLYLPSSKVKNIRFGDVTSQNERFLFISDWFIETNKVWKFLSANQTNKTK